MPGIKISKRIFPGVVRPDFPWQTIAVDDIGLWTSAIVSERKRFLGKALNLAGEELTGNEMATLLHHSLGDEYSNVKYSMVPRSLIRLLEHDLAIMANWIERTGYGADISKLKRLANDIGIRSTSLSCWFKQNRFT